MIPVRNNGRYNILFIFFITHKERTGLLILHNLRNTKYFNLGNNTYGRQDDFSFLQKKPPVYLGGYYPVSYTHLLAYIAICET